MDALIERIASGTTTQADAERVRAIIETLSSTMLIWAGHHTIREEQYPVRIDISAGVLRELARLVDPEGKQA